MKSDSGHIGELADIYLVYMAVVRDVFVQDCHLAASYACADITHAVVVSNLLMLVVWERLAGLGGVEHHLFFLLLTGHYQCAAA